jgi:tetratricopeptide (TPR) repeat protein
MNNLSNLTKFRTIGAALLIIAALGISLQAQMQPDKRAEKLAKDAYAEFYKGNYKKAIEISDKSIRTQPAAPYPYYVKGWSQFKMGLYNDALASLNTSQEKGQDPVEVSEPRGQVYYFLKDYANAQKDLEVFTASPKANGSANFVLAQLYLDQKNYGQALSKYQKAAELGYQNKDTQYFMALCYDATGDKTGAEKAAMAAVQADSQYKAEAYYLAGKALKDQKKYDNAIEALNHAVDLKPIREPYFALYDVYRLLNRDEDAIAIMKKRTREAPADVQAFLNLSWVSSLSDHPQDAVEAARQATKLNPKESVGFTNMCRAYNDLKLFDSAVQACNDALSIKPGDGETYFYLARAKYGQNKPSDAELYFNKAVIGLVDYTRANPDNADGYYLLGNAYYSSNQINKAMGSYQRALEINPRYVKARYNLALMYAKSGDYKSAHDQYELLVALDGAIAAKLLPLIEKPAK